MIDNTCTDHPKGGAGSSNAGGGGWDPNNHRCLDGNCGGPGFNTCNTCGKGTYRPEAIAYDGTSFELCWQEIGKPKSMDIAADPSWSALNSKYCIDDDENNRDTDWCNCMRKRNEGIYEEGFCTGNGCKKEFTLESWNQELDKVYAQKYLKSKCETCPFGYIQPAPGQSSCIVCPVGTYSDMYATKCESCVAGSFGSKSGKDHLELFRQSFTTCTVKTGGTNKNCAAANKNETTCDVATSSGGAGVPANKCIFVLGQISDTWNTCTVKNGGTNKNCAAANKNENTCDAATISGGAGVPANKCIFVDKHLYGIKAVCAGCAAGMYSEDKGSSICTDCPYGFVQPDVEKNACIECLSPTVAAGKGLKECTECIQGEKYANGKRNCGQCGEGQFGKSRGVCAECPSGCYQSRKEQTECKVTEIGKKLKLIDEIKRGKRTEKMIFDNTSPPEPCDIGTYGSEISKCTNCPKGWYQVSRQKRANFVYRS